MTAFKAGALLGLPLAAAVIAYLWRDLLNNGPAPRPWERLLG